MTKLIKRQTVLMAECENYRKYKILRFYSSIDECVRMTNVCMNKKDCTSAEKWLDLGAQHLWGFFRPLGWY